MSAWSLGDKKSAIKGRERALSTESSVPDSTDLNDYENGDEEDPAHGPADYNMKVLAELSIGDQAEVVNPFEPAHVPLNHRSQSWVRRIATKPWAVVLATFTALSIVFYFAFPNTIVLSNPLWVLTFDFAIKVLAAILSAFLERAIIRILKMIITDWIRPPCLQRLRYSIFSKTRLPLRLL
uniref:Uncharacterized protein n=1 Tax=Spongospora subterranea TaxID=70186 RepID=A0A0H5QHZ1_9EUKA|eukprot:CRZ00936.1 hypothetical protein [Spongospora subterranea]